MWNSIFKNSSVFNRGLSAILHRTYLAESYKLNSEWGARLRTPILQKVDEEKQFYEIDSVFAQQKTISPIDVDVYANKVTDDKHTDEISDLVQKLRSTQEATNLFDSTQHALIRNHIETNHLESLVQVLSHRLEYGVFLDNFSANILLDKLIEEKNFKLGARVATLIALQESFDNPITRYMSLYSCYKFLNNLEPFDDLVEQKPQEQEEVKPKKKKEEIRVRVGFIRNPYFDDHFDVKDSNHLLGKTFLCLADEIHSGDETLANSLKLIAFSLYEKFDDGNKFLASSKNGSFFKEAVDFTKSFSEKIENLDSNEAAKHYFDTVNGIGSLKDENLDALIQSLIKQSVQDQSDKDMEQQKKIYATWIEEREEKINNEINRMNRIQRLKNIEKIQDELQSEEKKLWYFDNEDKIDLEIDEKRVFYPKRWFGKKKKPRVVDEHYIPPDVDSRRNKR